MGVMIYRRVVNVYDIPLDILVETLGRGLTINRDAADFPLLEPSIGEGLGFNRSGAIAVQTGLGLHIDGSNRVACDLGSGLFHCEDGKVSIKMGGGLKFDEENNLAVDVGPGVTLVDNKVSVDTVPDPAMSTEFVTQIDSRLEIDAQKLTLTKVYQRHAVLKNAAGVVLGVVPGEVFEAKDDVILAVPYGYGYGSGDAKSFRTSTSAAPNFYKQ